MTEGSDSNSLTADTEMTDSTVWADSFCLSELEHLSHELANKGPQQSEVELRLVGTENLVLLQSCSLVTCKV